MGKHKDQSADSEGTTNKKACRRSTRLATQRSELWSPKKGDSKPFAVLSDCPSHLKAILQKVEFEGPDDPAFFVVYADDANIHAALGVAGSPVVQGANAAASATSFKNWVAARFRNADANRIGIRDQPGGAFSNEAFQRLSNHEAGDITNWSFTSCLGWCAAVMAAGHTTGKLYRMTSAAGGAAGNGRSPQGQRDQGVLFVIHR